MSRNFCARIVLILSLLLFAATGAYARLAVGGVEGSEGFSGNAQNMKALSEYLAEKLDQPVHVHMFRDSETLQTWMSRHREVDIAFVHMDFVRQRPAGEFLHLMDLQILGRRQLSPLLGIARQGLTSRSLDAIHQALISMDKEPAGRRLLQRFELERFVEVGSGLPRATEFIAPVRPEPKPEPRPEAKPEARPEARPGFRLGLRLGLRPG
ncbi:MAG: hypothetical protein SV239_13340, partial [Thermodesulfobacteriota bacterium]|nr:hypothetical protein [Thermodesulfobacteriota bacterium]